MGEVIGIIGLISVAKDVYDIAVSIKDIYKEYKNTDDYINSFLEEIRMTANVASMMKEYYSNMRNRKQNSEINVSRDVIETLVYLRTLLDSYKVAKVTKFDKVKHILWGKDEIEKIRSNILKLTCRLQNYSVLDILRNTTYLPEKLENISETTMNIKEYMYELKENKSVFLESCKEEFECLINNIQSIQFRGRIDSEHARKKLEELGILECVYDKDDAKRIISKIEGNTIVNEIPDDATTHSNIITIVAFLTNISHTNICKIEKVLLTEDEEMFLVSISDDYSTKLESLIGLNKMDDKTIHNVLIGVAKGLSYMHTSGFVHKSVNSKNILVNKDDPKKHQPKITGFYQSKSTDNVSGWQESDPYRKLWLPKEIIEGGEYTTSCDVYSFGVLMVEMYMDEPLTKCGNLEESNDIRKDLIEMLRKKCNNDYYIQLVEDCTNPDARKRIRVCRQVLESMNIVKKYTSYK